MLYYACLYAVNSLLLNSDVIVNTHSGIKSIFHKLFIKTGFFEKSLGKLYSELFDKRQEGNYQDFYLFEKDEIEPLIDKVEEFIKIINKQIKFNSAQNA